jgi:hypothetical protein
MSAKGEEQTRGNLLAKSKTGQAAIGAMVRA